MFVSGRLTLPVIKHLEFNLILSKKINSPCGLLFVGPTKF